MLIRSTSCGTIQRPIRGMANGAADRRVTCAPRNEPTISGGTNRHVRSGLRRRRARDHRAVLNRSWRRGHMRSDVCRAERAVLARLETDRVRYLRAFQRRWRDADPAAVNGLTVDEGVAIRHGYGIHVVGVHEIDIVNVRAEDVGVADKGVVNIDDRDEG